MGASEIYVDAIAGKIIDELLENMFKRDECEISHYQQYGNFDYVEI